MNHGPNITIETLLCTVCGMALALVADVESQKIMTTVIHAAVGAVVSFCVSLFLKWMIDKFKD